MTGAEEPSNGVIIVAYSVGIVGTCKRCGQPAIAKITSSAVSNGEPGELCLGHLLERLAKDLGDGTRPVEVTIRYL